LKQVLNLEKETNKQEESHGIFFSFRPVSRIRGFTVTPSRPEFQSILTAELTFSQVRAAILFLNGQITTKAFID
jgi:hypothetical protein